MTALHKRIPSQKSNGYKLKQRPERRLSIKAILHKLLCLERHRKPLNNIDNIIRQPSAAETNFP